MNVSNMGMKMATTPSHIYQTLSIELICTSSQLKLCFYQSAKGYTKNNNNNDFLDVVSSWGKLVLSGKEIDAVRTYDSTLEHCYSTNASTTRYAATRLRSGQKRFVEAC